MRLALGLLLAAAAGCQFAERNRTPDFGRAGRDRTRDNSRDQAKTAPADDDWTAPASTRADTLAGFVVLPDGAPARNVAVEIETGTGPGAPVEVRTDSAGYFRIPGLKREQPYTLTARATQNGTQFQGKLYARTGTEKSQRIRIELQEGAFPAPNASTPAPTPAASALPEPDMPALPKPYFTPNDVRIPGPGLTSAPESPPGVVEALPPPLVSRTPATPDPTPAAPPPLTVLPLVASPRRPEPQAATDAPYRPPTASVPPLRGPDRRAAPAAARKLAPLGTEFTLVDSAGVPRDFPTGDWVLLDFMTTSCQPCAKSVPRLNAIQDEYAASRLEVVGLCCDDTTARTRRTRLADYAARHAPNYPLLTEPADEPGALLERFKVEKYPTLILLDGAGKEVWRGHPADAGELRRYLERTR